MRHFAAKAASHATIDHRGHGIFSQRIGIFRDGQRRAAGEPDAGVVAGASVGIDAEAFAHHAPALARGTLRRRFLAPLPVEHALALRDDHLGAFFGGGQRLAQHVAHRRHIVGAGDCANPLHADAAHGIGDRLARGADGIESGGR